jgi:hypothetical protein
MITELRRPVVSSDLILADPLRGLTSFGSTQAVVEHEICGVAEEFIKLKKAPPEMSYKADETTETFYKLFWDLVNSYGQRQTGFHLPELYCPTVIEMIDGSVDLYKIKLGVAYSSHLNYGHDRIGLRVEKHNERRGKGANLPLQQTIITFSAKENIISNARHERYVTALMGPLMLDMATCLSERYARIFSTMSPSETKAS